MKYKLGRLPRTHDKRIPSYSMLAELANLPTLPDAVNHIEKMPEDFGMMGNAELGDCTCAAYYHSRQVWSFDSTGTEITEPDRHVLALYEQACGYQLGNPSSDNGGVVQDLMKYLLNTGAPIGPNALLRNRILAYFEINHSRQQDIRRTIYECGVAYIGINLPQSVMDKLDEVDAAIAENIEIDAWNSEHAPVHAIEEKTGFFERVINGITARFKNKHKERVAVPDVVWDVGGNEQSVGGHAIILVGYDRDGFTCISWGKAYRVTNAFIAKYTEEAYAIVDPSWVGNTGRTPLGMSVEQLEGQMQQLKR